MKVIYNQEQTPDTGKVIFLAGPTPRDAGVKSWRPEAIEILRASGFIGAVVVPEDRGFKNTADFDYDGQIEWERKNLLRADIVVFWIPRDIKDMPAFTTNIEFGLVSERKQPYVLGFPEGAPKMRYLNWVAVEGGEPVCHKLEETLLTACAMLDRKNTLQKKNSS